MKISFHKYQGAGNDFIMLNMMEQSINLSSDIIAQLCHRHYGIGADGLITISPSEHQDFCMTYYNADGHEGSMCGNGGRATALFAYHEKIVSEKMSFDAFDGIHQATITDNNIIKLQMMDVDNIYSDGNHFFIDTGSPHYIEFREHIEDIDLNTVGREIRYNYRKEGTNVNFLEKKDGVYHIRTYERGVENETLACGTGVTAAAIAIAVNKNISGQWISLKAKGGVLSVYLEKAPQGYKHIWLSGEAKRVFHGEINI